MGAVRGRRGRLALAGVVAVMGAVAVAGAAAAHVSERALVLLLPTDIYMSAGVAAVALTVLATLLLRPRAFHMLFPEGTAAPAGPDAPPGALGIVTSLAATGGLAFLLVAGLRGPGDPLVNMLPLVLFSGWWIGFPLLQALLGDLWRWVNPWRGVVRLVLRDRHAMALPAALGYWPALGTLLFAAGYALTDIAPSDPGRLAVAVGGYWLFTFAMCALFGPRWLRRGEGVGLFLHLLARLSPLDWSNRRPWPRLRMPGAALVNGAAPGGADDAGMSLGVFAVAALAIGSFDGLNETFWWMARLGINPLEFPGRSAVIWPNRAGLVLAVAGLGVLFALTVWAGLRLIGEQRRFSALFTPLALTLLPIALGYHAAHYLTTALVETQYLAVALFGLDPARVTTSFFNQYHTVRLIWLAQAGAIVLAHMLAILLAHAVALRHLHGHGRAVLSQLPVALFMLFYTLFGLWLLASPTAL